MKLVALDVGEKRIGVATADTAVKIAVPCTTIDVNGNEFAKIAEIMEEVDAGHLIVGLPRNSQGEETAQSKAVRAFVASLQEYFTENRLPKPLVKFQDESLTSVLARQNLAQNKRKKRKKSDVDKEAATLILQDFLDSFGNKELPKPNEEKPVDAKKKSKSKRIFLRIVAFVFVIVAVALVGAATWYSEALKPVAQEEDCKSGNVSEKCKKMDFVVSSAESTTAIAERLENEGLIKSALSLKIYLKLHEESYVLKAGTYSLSSTMSVIDILDTLTAGSSAETFRLTFLPGGSVADAKAQLANAGYRTEEIEEAFAANYDHPVMEGKPENGSLEGFIYGETYEFYASASVKDILKRVFDELYTVVETNGLKDKYAVQGLSLYEGIALASVVQKEAYSADQPTVAQVFLLRLKRGIVLGSDAIIGYRADQINPGRDKTDLSYLNTIDCPWNSRKCAGLPPTPISNPGASALIAVGSPTDTEYIYFLTGDDNKMYYAYTQAEHEQNIKNHCKTMCTIL